MHTKQYSDLKAIANSYATLFQGKPTAYVRFDLREVRRNEGSHLLETIDGRRAELIGRCFAKQLNQFCFGNASRRYNKIAIVLSTIHQLPHWHLHIIAEIPGHMTIEQIDSFTQAFVENNSWVKPNRSGAYCEPTDSIIGSLIYNARFGSDTIIVC